MPFRLLTPAMHFRLGVASHFGQGCPLRVHQGSDRPGDGAFRFTPGRILDADGETPAYLVPGRPGLLLHVGRDGRQQGGKTIIGRQGR